MLYLELAALVLVTDGLSFLLCGAGPKLVRVNSNSWIRLNSDGMDANRSRLICAYLCYVVH